MTPILATVAGQAFANHGVGGELAPGLEGARVSFTPVQLDQAAAVVDALTPVEVRTDAQGMIPPTGLWPGEWRCRNHRDLSEFAFVSRIEKPAPLGSPPSPSTYPAATKNADVFAAHSIFRAAYPPAPCPSSKRAERDPERLT